MRTIRFRAWDKEGEKMYYPGSDWGRIKHDNGDKIYLTFNGRMFEHDGRARACSEYTDHFILMQYTGLKSKSGIEIYEGDILKSGTLIKYEKGGDYYTSWIGFEIPEMEEDDLEVIGNIYQDSHLLNE